MLSNFALHGYSFGGSAHGVVPAFFYRCPGRPRVGWRRHEPAPETSSLETVSSSEESCELQYGRLTRARSQPSNVATPEREWAAAPRRPARARAVRAGRREARCAGHRRPARADLETRTADKHCGGADGGLLYHRDHRTAPTCSGAVRQVQRITGASFESSSSRSSSTTSGLSSKCGTACW